MNTFPKTEAEFHQMFNNEDACIDYLISARWPNGFQCPACGSKSCWPRKNKLHWICADCNKETSLRAGTVFHNSSKPLMHWFLAMFHMTRSKRGVSALELQRMLGCNYSTALRWLRELRRAMGYFLENRPLSGEVEVDEMVIGGVAKGREQRGFGGYNKTIVAGAVERRGANGSGRARLRCINARSSSELAKFVAENISPNSLLLTDNAPAYSGLSSYLVYPISMKRKQVKTIDITGRAMEEVHLGRAHRVFTLVKRIVLGTYHGGIRKQHLQGYLDEYAFRFENRDDGFPVLLPRLIKKAASHQAVPLWKSVGRKSPKVSTFKRNQEWQDYARRLK